MIDLAKLKELVQLMAEHGLTEVHLQDSDQTVQLKRGAPATTIVNHQPVIYGGPGPMPGVFGGAHPAGAAPHPAGSPAAAPAPPGGPGTPAPAAPPAGAPPDAGLVPITSPMVGTFYAAANPDSPPFASVGTAVSPETTVCLIEAMKVFNEIKAEATGTIERVLVKNGQAVEYGQKLYMVRPA
ncbi:MAG: acetyl-CoA carboxylase biotin carboxyl carrier protein [Isosphaera sp.]|nr:acetyl-CoA carboxylase biotin carboxyl carrier protein [Isosphaera sp.]